MELREYVTIDEVQRVCRDLGLRDWTDMKDATVPPEEAKMILNVVCPIGMTIPVETFREGLEVELEHGTRYDDANVTNNHPVLTGRIVLAHLKESMDYYKRLAVAELEGDLIKYIAARNMDKIASVYARLAQARVRLAQAEAEHLA